MRLLSLVCASIVAGGPAAAASPDADLIPVVAEYRLASQSVSGLAWRDAQGRFYAPADVLTRLGLRKPARDPAALADIAGLSYHWDEAQSALVLTCGAACYAPRVIEAQTEQAQITPAAPGAFLNLDLSATDDNNKSDAAGLFDLGVFGLAGFGEATWTVDAARGRATRLETQWTFDTPGNRTRLRLGDSIAQGGALAAPFRFGGVQFGTDFTLQPGFVSFPTPNLNGDAATPSAVDLYVDGALRLQQNVEPGPFSIANAPVLTGAGVAQVVVRDALGREQVYSEPFYASPTMLRAGLADYAIAVGAERQGFTYLSDEYGRSFASGVYRYGLTNWLTAETRLDTSADGKSASFAASVAQPWLGQVDLAWGRSWTAREGEAMRAAWSYAGQSVSAGLSVDRASAEYFQLADRLAPPKQQAAAYVGFDLARFGSGSLAITDTDYRDRDSVRTIALNFAPRFAGDGSLSFSALRVEDPKPYLVVGLVYAARLGLSVDSTASVESRGGHASVAYAMQTTPDPVGGFGWRASASSGYVDRIDAAVAYLGAHGAASLEFSHAYGGDGLRGTLQTGIAWIGGRVMASRPIDNSFALVEAGAPGVAVYQEHRQVAVTDARGEALVTNLRAYESNHVGIGLDDLPIDVPVSRADADVTPGPRSGVVVRLGASGGRSGEVRIDGANGAPLPVGAMLTRDEDGARFPVGEGGRIYVTGLGETTRFNFGAACWVELGAAQLGGEAQLTCAAPS